MSDRSDSTDTEHATGTAGSTPTAGTTSSVGATSTADSTGTPATTGAVPATAGTTGTGESTSDVPATTATGTTGTPGTPGDDPGVAAIVDRLGLVPHPEGGWYGETWRHDAGDGERGAGTAIYYLLAAGQRSHWHRVDATEIWHFYAGAPLRLRIHGGDGPTVEVMLGADLLGGQIPQAIVPDGAWQAAEPTGPWALVGCTVSPGFTFEGFELAPADWEPPAGTA